MPGTAGITKITLTQVPQGAVVPPNGELSVKAVCPAGKVVGGGFQLGDVVNVTSSNPEGSDAWRVVGRNTTAFNQAGTAWAICMTTEPSTVIATASKAKNAKKKGR